MSRLIVCLLAIITYAGDKSAEAINGFIDVKFGTKFDETKSLLMEKPGFKTGIDRSTAQQFIAYQAQVYGFKVKNVVDFKDGQVIEVRSTLRDRSPKTLGTCRTRFATLLDNLKGDYQSFKLVTNTQNFDGLVTENGYLIFEDKTHIHLQMDFFSAECGVNIKFAGKPPSFLDF
ncbi:MAG: hypothetical protein AAGB12_04915 [Pseudomonadota bacterium]